MTRDFQLGDTVCMRRSPTLPLGRVVAIVKKTGYWGDILYGAGTVFVRTRSGGKLSVHQAWITRMVWTRPINLESVNASPQ